MYIVVAGNAVDGLAFYGPFDYSDVALDWAQRAIAGEQWLIADLQDSEE
jgi:hypothetical protein